MSRTTGSTYARSAFSPEAQDVAIGGYNSEDDMLFGSAMVQEDDDGRLSPISEDSGKPRNRHVAAGLRIKRKPATYSALMRH